MVRYPDGREVETVFRELMHSDKIIEYQLELIKEVYEKSVFMGVSGDRYELKKIEGCRFYILCYTGHDKETAFLEFWHINLHVRVVRENNMLLFTRSRQSALRTLAEQSLSKSGLQQ